MKIQIIISIILLTSLSTYSQRYTFVGPQIFAGVATNSFDNKIKPSIGAGIVADWLVRGDKGALRLGVGYQGFSSSVVKNNSVSESFVSQIDIPLTYRWTFIRRSLFNFQLGNGIMIPTKKDLKLAYYLTYGVDYIIPSSRNGYFLLGLNLKHSINSISINNAYNIAPILAQVNLSWIFKTSPKS